MQMIEIDIPTTNVTMHWTAAPAETGDA